MEMAAEPEKEQNPSTKPLIKGRWNGIDWNREGC